MGRIADNAKSNVPVTWDMLSKDKRVGDATLTEREKYVIRLIFGVALEEATENALDQLVIEYAGKRLALEVIDVAIDLISHLSQMESTQQPVEIVQFPDRLKNLKEQKKDLIVGLAELEPLVVGLIPNLQARRSRSAPLLSSMNDDLLTPNPGDLGPIYAPLETR
jgi:hypothetical protein